MTDREKYMAVAKDMAEMLYSDSRVPVSESVHRLFEALVKDDRLPSLYEKEVLIFGGPVDCPISACHPETDGEGNPEVTLKFPHTDRIIGSFF